MRHRFTITLCVLSMICQAQHSRTYQLIKKTELSIGGACLLLGVTDQILSNNLKPLGDEDILGLRLDDLPSFDRSATRQNSISAKDLSDVLEYAAFLIPTPLLLSERFRDEIKEAGLMYFEAFSLNVFSTQFVKFVVRRPRPFMYNESIEINSKRTANGRKSFYSGHVSHTATLSIFTAKVFSDLYPESKWKPLIWAGAFAVPVTTGYLRYRAGQHFPSDVLVGLIAGSLIGYFVPEWHRIESSLPDGLSINSRGNGISLSYSF